MIRTVKNRKWLAIPIAASLLMGTAAVLPVSGTVYAESAASQTVLKMRTVQMKWDGKLLSVPAGMTADNETFVALSFLSKQLGLRTSWDAKTRIISVSGKNRTMKMKADDYYFWLNGNRIYGTPPVVLKGTTYLPLRFLLEQMGFAIGYDAKAKVISIQPIIENDLKLVGKLLEDASEFGEVTVQYPQLEGFADKAVQDKINEVLKAEAEEYFQSGQELMVDYEGYAAEMGDEIPPMAFDVSYSVTYNEKNRLSLQYNIYEYSGGAHGMYDYQPHNFNLETGEEITLKEAALGNENYIGIINEAVKKGIKEQDLYLLSPFETIAPDQRFFIRGDSIVVFFGLYEYTPYAAGMPEFSIPFSRFAAQ
ncbi:DUF4163 domain-containing protein [Paenibacillus oenotherae]|uniref:DUF4163 domain-containing protein n=1 Tax=Paenibacillus oenotherae TaxID=1435645 RepID=A0ABS7DAI4_9BACL|nr:stalk domain-containing protein [Paenibacillus oenotherae]MBW7476896.1 DUF4163 domain-containing protein [Paenibacillus oenotherae]